jgi:hypothetical protein
VSRPPLDRGHRLRADQAVRGGDLLAALGHEASSARRSSRSEQQEPAIVGQLERDLQHPGLHVVELEDAGEQAGADLADGGAHGMARLAEEVPEDDGAGLGCVALQPGVGDPLLDLVVRDAGHRQGRRRRP